MARKRGFSTKFMFLSIILVILSVGFILGKVNLYIASLSLIPQPLGDVILISEAQENGLIKVGLRFRTGTDETDVEAVSTLATRLILSSSDQANIELVDKDGKEIDNIVPNEEFATLQEWKFPVNRFEKREKELVVDFAAVDMSQGGYSTHTYKSLASFYLSGLKNKEKLQFRFDSDLSQMFSKRRPVTDIWEE